MDEPDGRSRVPVVVIVDDQPEHRHLLRLMIRDHCQVIEAASSEEALAIVQERHVDVVMTDSNLPNFDGKQLCQQLKLAGPVERVIIFVTGNTQPGSVMEMLDAGANDIVVKPYKRERVLAALREATGRFGPLPKGRRAAIRMMSSVQRGLFGRKSPDSPATDADDDPSL